jgi:hypothetical protein
MRLLLRAREFVFLGWKAREEAAYHVMNADKRFVQCRCKCLCCAGTNAETARHTYSRAYMLAR